MRGRDGGPAFPAHVEAESSDGQEFSYTEKGMSLRDWFAGQVFAAAMVNAEGLGNMTPESRGLLLKRLADLSYESADAMLAAREGRDT